MADAAPLSPGSVRTLPTARGGSVLLRVRGAPGEGEHLRRDLLLALADDPPGLVCDLSSTTGPLPTGAVTALLAVAGQAQLWPGTPVAVVCPDPAARSALAAGPLVVTESLHPALVAVRARAVPEVARTRLPPHPVAARAARDFLTRTCGGWDLHAVDAGCLAVSELVTAAMATSAGGIDVSVRRTGEDLALAVRSGCAVPDAVPGAVPDAAQDLPAGPGPVVEALSRATGVLVAANGRVVTWAVLPTRCGG